MIILAFLGGVLVITVVAAGVYDYRARRRGWRTRVSAEEALQNRLDVEATDNPRLRGDLQGGSHGWMTYRQRDRKDHDE